MLKLYVGDISISGGNLLITEKNYKRIIQRSQSEDIVAHTSFADMAKSGHGECSFYDLLTAATEIIYKPPTVWSDSSKEYSMTNMQLGTEYLLSICQRRFGNVTGLNLSKWNNPKYLNTVDKRADHRKQMWVAGCSCTKGEGISYEQRYGSILGARLNMPVAFLAAGGSGIDWQADQILRSDIRSGDIVVWGLTSEYRSFTWYNDSVKHTKPIDFVKAIDELSNEQGPSIAEDRLYKSLLAVKQVENFCTKIDVRLIIFPVIVSEVLKIYMQSSKNFYDTDYVTFPYFIDQGTDNKHPGPQQHEIWADFLHNHI